MIIRIDKMWIKKPELRQSKTGKLFWTFYTSLGKNASNGKFKGTLNCITFMQDLDLKDKQCLNNVVGDLYTDMIEGKTYYKLKITGMQKEEPLKDIVVDEVVAPVEPVATAQFGEKIIEIPTDNIDWINEDDGKEVKE